MNRARNWRQGEKGMAMRWQALAAVVVAVVAGCAPVAVVGPVSGTAAGAAPGGPSGGGNLPPAVAGPPLSASAAARNFVAVVDRVEPMAEAYCRRAGTPGRCDFRILIDDDPGAGANAWQTVDAAGRPTITFTLALIADARNADELALVMGHEAAHHIAGHIPLSEQSALAGALVAGLLATAAGMDATGLQQAENLGAQVGALTYAKDYELQADAIGAEIAWRAGYDPLRGLGFFDRIPDPGDMFLGSHPGSARRKAVVAEVVAELNAGG